MNVPSHRQRLVFLDGIRGLAAFAVFIGHAFPLWGWRPGHAYLAVDLFFLLSGFVIAGAYEHRLASGAMTFRDFVLARLIRIMPMYLLSVPFAVAEFAVQNPDIASGRILAAALGMGVLLPIPIPGSPLLFAMNPVYWTLFYELLVNILYAALRPRLGRRLLLAMVVLPALVFIVIDLSQGYGVRGAQHFPLDVAVGMARACFGIFAGVLLYRLRGHFSSLPRFSGGVMVAALLAAMLAPVLPGGWNIPYDFAAMFLLLPVGIVMLSHAVVRTRLGAQVLVLSGAASYPFYVLHYPIAQSVARLWPTLGQYAPAGGIVFGFLLLAVAAVLDITLDIPLRKRLSTRWIRQPVVTENARP
jgi:peptidoglycan/LPS O-acetylase OafA/YrhL